MTQNPIDIEAVNNADGGQIRMGVVARLLKWLGSDIILTGSGSAVITFPTTSGTLVDRDHIWPINSVHITTDNVNPGTTLGFGTWAAFGSGRVLVGYSTGETEFDAAGETGGEKTHALSVAELAAHAHVQNAHAHATDGHTHNEVAHAHSHNHLVQNNAQSSYARALGTGVGNQAGTGVVISTTGNILKTADDATPATPTMDWQAPNAQATTATDQNAGSGTAHNNLQPYIVVFFWKRTA